MNKIWRAVGCILILAGVALTGVSTICDEEERTNDDRSIWLTNEVIYPHIDRSPHSWHYFQLSNGLGDRVIAPFIYRLRGFSCILIDLSIESALMIHCEVGVRYLWVTAVSVFDRSIGTYITTYNFMLGNAGTYFIGVDGNRSIDRIEIKYQCFPFHDGPFDTYPYALFLPIRILFVILGAVIVSIDLIYRKGRAETD